MAEFIVSVAITAPLFSLLVPAIILIMRMFVVKTSKNTIGSVDIYEFSDIETFIESTLPTAVGQTKAHYNYFESVYETRDTI